jgi:hypothetical protein
MFKQDYKTLPAGGVSKTIKDNPNNPNNPNNQHHNIR